MMNCWQSELEARPSFNDLTQQLKRMENQNKVRLKSKLFNKVLFLFVEWKCCPLIALHQAAFTYN